MRHEIVLDRVEMDVIHVGGEIAIIADRVLPVPPLPNAAFATVGHPIAAVVRQERSMPGLGERRNALPLFRPTLVMEDRRRNAENVIVLLTRVGVAI